MIGILLGSGIVVETWPVTVLLRNPDVRFQLQNCISCWKGKSEYFIPVELRVYPLLSENRSYILQTSEILRSLLDKV